MSESKNKPDVTFGALVLVECMYRKKLIDRKTYQNVMRRYGYADGKK